TALGGEEQGSRFDQQTLPLRGDGSGVLDLDKASPVVKALLGGAARAKDNGGLTRVSVADGTGRADTISSRAMASSKLLGSGYTPLDQGVVAPAPTTSVLVPDQDATGVGKQVALTMGLPDSAVRVQAFDTTLTDVRVVLGADWTQLGQVPADQPPTPSDTGGATSGATSSAGAPDGRTGTGGTSADGKSSTGKATTTRKPTSGNTH
ncbi:MAG: LytR C-terminal domain-containing protein, partial [Catenulispora sp.]|nr:LytR C-terminal domain-containing protein [Catenulispora sp.]